MIVRFRQSSRLVAAVLAAFTLAGGLTGCSSINEKLASGMGEYIPQWAGGLPADAPPRPGTAKYDEFMRERERKRQQPAAERDTPGQTATASGTQPAPAR
jgi:hypothetical protein